MVLYYNFIKNGDTFLQTYMNVQLCMTSTFNGSLFQLQLEVDRLEELKMQNMKKVIEAIRVELAQYWDQCFYSQEQRQAFAPYYTG